MSEKVYRLPELHTQRSRPIQRLSAAIGNTHPARPDEEPKIQRTSGTDAQRPNLG
jgi:hypothetical protein